MACYEVCPPELKLQIMQSMSDVCSLYALTLASPAAEELYKMYVCQVFKAVMTNQPPQLAETMRKAFVTRHCNGKLRFRVEDQKPLLWQVLSTHNIWKDAERLKSEGLDTLKDFANTANHLSELAIWAEAHQHDEGSLSHRIAPCATEIRNSALGASSLTFDDINYALWQLHLYLIRTSTLDVGKPPKSRYYPSGNEPKDQTYEKQHLLSVSLDIKEFWLTSFKHDELRNLSQVLSILENGYGRLTRHMLTPATDSMLHALFSPPESKACFTRDLKIRAAAHLLALEPNRPFQSFADAQMDFRNRGAKDDSAWGVLRDQDVKERDRDINGGCSDDGRHYLERFRPLIGLAYGSKVPVAELVGGRLEHDDCDVEA